MLFHKAIALQLVRFFAAVALVIVVTFFGLAQQGRACWEEKRLGNQTEKILVSLDDHTVFARRDCMITVK